MTDQTPGPAPGGELSIAALLNVFLRRQRLLIGLPLVAALVTLPVTFLLPRRYSATTTFVPESGRVPRLPAGLSALAGQLNLDLLAGQASQSPRFYAELVGSREISDRVLLSRYAARSGGDSVRLLDLLRVRGRTLNDSLERGRRVLRKRVGTRVSAQTGVVRLDVTMSDPRLAAEVANRFVQLLNEFNSQYRQSQARERRRFVQEQASSAERELREAENRLRDFYQTNRLWQQSSQLTFEEGRLRRQVEIRQEVFMTLRRELESARIEEVNDTPVITVVDSAVPPQRRSFPNRKVLLLSALFAGLAVAGAWAVVAEYLAGVRRFESAVYAEMLEHLAVWRRLLPGGAGRA